jgi:hypothetical protein
MTTTTRQMISFSVLVLLLALSTGWIVERAIHATHPGGAGIRGSQSDGGAAASEPAPASDAVRPAATGPEYDRSDLLLTQG